MTKTLEDQAAREIAVHSRDRTVWLEAGAGSGKTKTLVDRIVSLIREDHRRPVARIAAITFTEKAAAELKGKVRAELEKHQRDSIGDRVLARALAELDAAPIMTIHAFSTWLLQQRPVEAGIDPAVAVLDSDAESALRERTYDEWFDGLLAEPPAALVWFLRQREYRARRDEYDWLWTLCRMCCNEADLVAAIEPDRSFDPMTAFGELLRSAEGLLAEAKSACLKKEDLGFSGIESYVAALRSVPADDYDEWLPAFVNVAPIKLTGGAKGNWEAGALDGFKDARKALQALHKELAASAYSTRVWELYELARDFAARFDARKRRLGALGFQDMLLRARDLLRDDRGGVRAALNGSFDAILVDEFQDTDPLQVEIVTRLVEVAADGGVRPGKLFVVGDPKQSIYRFRRADIEVYEQTKSVWLGAGAPEFLTVNFRCAPAIVDLVNTVFGIIMTLDPDLPASPQYVPLVSGRRDGFGLPVPEGAGVVTLKPDRVLVRGDAHRDWSYAAIAAWIRSAVDEGVTIVDPVTKVERPVRFGDMAILNRRGTTFEQLEEYLRGEGVPYLVVGSKAYFRRPEVVGALAGLRALTDPSDTLALAEWLTSDLVGFTDQDLLLRTLDREGGTLSYRNECEARTGLDHHLEALRSLHEGRNRSGCVDTWRRLLALGAGPAGVGLLRRGEVAAANLRRIEEAALDADASGTPFDVFVRHWADALEREKDDADHAVAEEGDNVVQLLTIHKAKGLDWPIVILPDLDAGFQGGSGAVLFHRVGRRVEVRLRAGFETTGYAELAAREAAFEKAEAARLLYVGMTRARDYLVLPWFVRADRNRDGTLSKRSKGFVDFFRQAEILDDDLDPTIGFGSSAREVVYPVNELEARVRAATRTPKAVTGREVSDSGEAAIPESEAALVEEALARYTARPAVAPAEPPILWTSPSAGDDEVPDDISGAGDGAPEESRVKTSTGRSAALRVGSAFHSLMEALEWERPDRWGATQASVAAEFGLDANEQRKLRRWLETFARSKTFQDLLLARRWTEIPFTWRGSGEDGVVVDFNGRLDLLALEDRKAVIVDFKTDGLKADEIDQRFVHYRRQGEIYRDAVRTLVPDLENVTARFCFVDSGEEREV